MISPKFSTTCLRSDTHCPGLSLPWWPRWPRWPAAGRFGSSQELFTAWWWMTIKHVGFHI